MHLPTSVIDMQAKLGFTDAFSTAAIVVMGLTGGPR